MPTKFKSLSAVEKRALIETHTQRLSHLFDEDPAIWGSFLHKKRAMSRWLAEEIGSAQHLTDTEYAALAQRF